MYEASLLIGARPPPPSLPPPLQDVSLTLKGLVLINSPTAAPSEAASRAVNLGLLVNLLWVVQLSRCGGGAGLRACLPACLPACLHSMCSAMHSAQ